MTCARCGHDKRAHQRVLGGATFCGLCHCEAFAPGPIPMREQDDTPTVCAHCLRAVAECGCAKGETR